MKNRIILYCLLCFSFSQAQISIGKNTVDGNGLIDFSSTNKGIILPVVNVDSNLSYANGTFLYDINDNVIKIRENNTWLPISFEGTLNEFMDESNNQVNTKRVVSQSIDEGKGVVIGNTTSSADGVLVFESTTHAMILPKVTNPHLNILSPTAGTVVYDIYSKSLAVFDGKVWNYWK